jgi:Pretoxin HINT domain
MNRIYLNALKISCLLLWSISAKAVVDPPFNPPTGSNAAGGSALIEFDWQKNWGSIHMNSYADGLRDPGSPVNNNGQVPCASGGFCADMKRPASDGLGATNMPGHSGQIANGIKYDIKNSVLNCMSKLLPNWAYNHAPGYGRGYVCGVNGVPQMGPQNISSDYTASVRWMSYAPLWDRRSNDERTETSGGPGCQQQISNYCGNPLNGTDIRDVHACVKQSQAPEVGGLHPTTHVFSPEEVADLGGRGAIMPSKYYYFDKIIQKGNWVRNALSLPSDGVYSDESSHSAVCVSDNTSYGNIQHADKNKTTCQNDNDPDTLLSSCDGNSNPVDAQKCSCKTQSVTITQVSNPCTKYDYREVTQHRPGFSTDLNDKLPTAPIIATVDTNNAQLARIKSRYFSNVEPTNNNFNKFVIMDPSEFFDMKMYVSGGKYDSGYNQFSAPGVPATVDSCPVLGLNNGYGGICDPEPESATHSNAGCNLAIYGVGPETTFSDALGNSFNYNNYPVKWSGYVKKWAVISRAQYAQNIEKRIKQGRNIYLSANPKLGETNDNPILMLTRAKDYCDNVERSSNPEATDAAGTPLPPDMECIQYLQLQETSGVKISSAGYLFMNLYSPEEIHTISAPVGYTMMYTHERNPDTGAVIKDKPIPGTGSNKYVAGTMTGTGTIFASFKDAANPKTIFQVRGSGNKIVNIPAVRNLDYLKPLALHPITKRQIAGKVYSTHKTATGAQQLTPGEYLDPSTAAGQARGAGLILEPGSVSSIKTEENLNFGNSAISSRCAMISYRPPVSDKDVAQNVFIPTNSDEEFQAFVSAGMRNETGTNISLRPCEATFESNVDTAKRALSNPVQGASTWNGMINCDSLVAKPACNQAKLITGQRFCQLENGLIDNCSACSGSEDPDKINFTDALVHGEVMANPSINKNNRCYFSAACFNNNAGGCPSAGTAGGHVFCLAPETQITMADGSMKEIKSIKAGDQVLSFDTKFSKDGTLTKKKVKATAITKNQEIIKIDDLRITPLHKIVLSTGRAVMAKDVKVGDKILKSDGLVTTVMNVQAEQEPITVYNLVLENDNYGYVANGIRVLSYPKVKGMEN